MQTASISSKWYHSINDLPLRKYIDVTVNQNIYALVITGKPSDKDLFDAWESICDEYEDAIGESEHKFYTILFKEVAILSATYEQIQLLISLLTLLNVKNIYSEYFYSELNQLLKTSFSFSRTDCETNAQYLKRCNSRSKGIKLMLDLKQSQLNGIEGNRVQGKKPTKEYYQSILISLSDHAKYPVTDEITVFEFCERIRRFNQYYEQLKRQTNGRK